MSHTISDIADDKPGLGQPKGGKAKCASVTAPILKSPGVAVGESPGPRADKQPRVKLIKEITVDLPKGSMGTVISAAPIPEHGMVLVRWDCQVTIPMYCGEVERVEG